MNEELNDRERRCVYLAAEGHQRKRIAELMFLSDKTVKSYMEKARRKKQAQNTTHLVAICLREGIIE